MTVGNDPLVCACGKHTAVFDQPKKKGSQSRWRLFSSDRPSGKGKEVGNRSQKVAALQAVIELCKGTYSKRPPSTKPVPTARPRTARSRPNVSMDDTARRQSRIAGPGRGHKRPVTQLDALSLAQNSLKRSKASECELRTALGKLTHEHSLLLKWHEQVVSERDRAYAMLRDEYQLGQDEEADRQRRAVVMDLVGEGYDMSGSCRTFQRHKAMALAAVTSIAGPDTVKQQQLAEAMLSHYATLPEDHSPSFDDYEAQAAIIAGIAESLEVLRKRNGGRFTSQDRITQEVLLGAATVAAKDQMLSAIGQRPYSACH
jgi:hypothetical protein